VQGAGYRGAAVAKADSTGCRVQGAGYRGAAVAKADSTGTAQPVGADPHLSPLTAHPHPDPKPVAADPDLFEGTSDLGWERFKGPDQLRSPASYGMATLQAAAVPAASCHANAHGLATFYAALADGRLLDEATLTSPPPPCSGGASHHPGGASHRPRGASHHPGGASHRPRGASQPATWHVGLQVGECTPLSFSSARRPLVALGHSATGGSIGLCVPERRIALAVTVNKLSSAAPATQRIVDMMLTECGLELTAGLEQPQPS